MSLWKLFYSQPTSVSAIIISVALMLMCGFLLTRLTKLAKLPNVTAYILTGIILGPYCFGLVPQEVIVGMDFISDIALAFIAFSVGEFFRFDTLKQNGKSVIIITLFEAILASVFVFVLTYVVLGIPLAFSIILSALASATAPASTVMTIRQTEAKGDFVDTLLSVVALDDIVSLVAYSVAISVAMSVTVGGFDVNTVIMPIVWNLVMIAIGIGCGFLLKFLMMRRSVDNRLIVSIALLFGICGVGAILDVSPLLACMAMGTVYINVTDDDKLFKQLNYFSPPILLLFFVKSGLGFRLDALTSTSTELGVPILLVGVLYFIVRIVGKYAGSVIGGLTTGKPNKTTFTLGLALIPQAGVSIGLAAMGARLLTNMGYGEMGDTLQTVILSSSILYELLGPAMAKLALYLSGSFNNNDTEEVKPIRKTAKQIADEERNQLVEKLNQIQATLAVRDYSRSEEEQAFTEAAMQDDEFLYNRRNTKFINRR